jgi:phosphoribosylamine--glycine ligase
LPAAQDYKRVAEGDRGPNTGGMGSFCPADQLTPEIMAVVKRDVILPVLAALAKQGSEYRGILYAGLMLTDSGPQVIEFNCRFGDPETQVIVPVWDGSIIDVMSACIESSLETVDIPTGAVRSAVCVVMAAEGYPGSYSKDLPLTTVNTDSNHLLFHAGTANRDGVLRSSGGRVLNAVGVGEDLATARARAYELAASLKVPGLFYREDIATHVDHDSTRSTAYSAR